MKVSCSWLKEKDFQPGSTDIVANLSKNMDLLARWFLKASEALKAKIEKGEIISNVTAEAGKKEHSIFILFMIGQTPMFGTISNSEIFHSIQIT